MEPLAGLNLLAIGIKSFSFPPVPCNNRRVDEFPLLLFEGIN
jgi:hypothetical protein